MRESENAHKGSINENQPGDPEKFANALIKMSEEKNPALHLFVGQDAYDMANVKIAEVQKELEQWKAVSVSTGF